MENITNLNLFNNKTINIYEIILYNNISMIEQLYYIYENYKNNINNIINELVEIQKNITINLNTVNKNNYQINNYNFYIVLINNTISITKNHLTLTTKKLINDLNLIYSIFSTNKIENITYETFYKLLNDYKLYYITIFNNNTNHEDLKKINKELSKILYIQILLLQCTNININILLLYYKNLFMLII